MAEGLTPAEARAQREHELESRRAKEAACALDFLVYGDGQDGTFLGHRVVGVTHAERCVFGPRHACSRTYDPAPIFDNEAFEEPLDLKLYEGTSIGALYGMPGPELDLEGWTLAPGTVYE